MQCECAACCAYRRLAAERIAAQGWFADDLRFGLFCCACGIGIGWIACLVWFA